MHIQSYRHASQALASDATQSASAYLLTSVIAELAGVTYWLIYTDRCPYSTELAGVTYWLIYTDRCHYSTQLAGVTYWLIYTDRCHYST